MMFDIDLDHLRQGFWRSLPVALFVGAAIVIELSLVLWVHFGNQPQTGVLPLPADHDNARALGELLYSRYIYPLEIAGMILLVAMVSAISLTIRRRKDAKAQKPGEQVRVRAADRVRLVSMPAVRPAPPEPPPADEGAAEGAADGAAAGAAAGAPAGQGATPGKS